MRSWQFVSRVWVRVQQSAAAKVAISLLQVWSSVGNGETTAASALSSRPTSGLVEFSMVRDYSP